MGGIVMLASWNNYFSRVHKNLVELGISYFISISINDKNENEVTLIKIEQF